jgi:TatD DNase family protein
MKSSIVDIGANLTNGAFERDRDEVVKRALDSGVQKIIVTASNLDSSRKAAALALLRPGVLYSTAGIHPHDAKSADASAIAALRLLLGEPHIVACGECGLDFNRNYSEPKTQELWFDAQVALACELGKPLFLHERDAHARFLGILLSHKSSLPRAVVHCFTGSREELFAYLDNGFSIGITGWICDERRGLGLRELVREIPLDRLMIETDAPFLYPRTMHPRPKSSRNEPAFLTYVLREAASSLKISEEEIASVTYANSVRFFGL